MTVSAEFTRRAVIVTPDTAGVITDTWEVQDAVQRLRWKQAGMVAAVQNAEDESLRPATRRRARFLIDELDSERAYAAADVERAIRAANPTAPEAAVMAAARAL